MLLMFLNDFRLAVALYLKGLQAGNDYVLRP